MGISDYFGLVGVRLDGKYDVDAVVAEGGFGVVYRATHRALQKPVAVKVLKTPNTIPDSARKEFIEKFLQEARIIAHLEHPAIVRVLDFGGGLLPSGGAAPWLVLEWIDGQSLDDDLEARRYKAGRSPTETLALLRPIFEALSVAHDEGIAHRDLKPANVMLARTRRGIEPRLLDFGIAKAMGTDESVSSGMTVTSSIFRSFTLAYASPEQLGGTRTGPWTDVHALGLLVVELLTNSPPFSGEDATEQSADVLSPVRPTPAKFGLDVGPWERVLAKALALRASERFQHAGEFLRALEVSMPATVTWNATRVSLTPARPPLDGTTVTTLRPVHRPAPPPNTRPLWIALALVASLVTIAAIAGIISIGRTSTTRGSPQVQTPVSATAPVATPTIVTAVTPPTPVVPTPMPSVETTQVTPVEQRLAAPEDAEALAPTTALVAPTTAIAPRAAQSFRGPLPSLRGLLPSLRGPLPSRRTFRSFGPCAPRRHHRPPFAP